MLSVEFLCKATRLRASGIPVGGQLGSLINTIISIDDVSQRSASDLLERFPLSRMLNDKARVDSEWTSEDVAFQSSASCGT